MLCLDVCACAWVCLFTRGCVSWAQVFILGQQTLYKLIYPVSLSLIFNLYIVKEQTYNFENCFQVTPWEQPQGSGTRVPEFPTSPPLSPKSLKMNIRLLVVHILTCSSKSVQHVGFSSPWSLPADEGWGFDSSHRSQLYTGRVEPSPDPVLLHRNAAFSDDPGHLLCWPGQWRQQASRGFSVEFRVYFVE